MGNIRNSGLREDLDYITAYKEILKDFWYGWIDNHRGIGLNIIPCSKNDLYIIQKYYLVYGGIKYISLNWLVVEMKRKRMEVKDKRYICV